MRFGRERPSVVPWSYFFFLFVWTYILYSLGQISKSFFLFLKTSCSFLSCVIKQKTLPCTFWHLFLSIFIITTTPLFLLTSKKNTELLKMNVVIFGISLSNCSFFQPWPWGSKSDFSSPPSRRSELPLWFHHFRPLVSSQPFEMSKRIWIPLGSGGVQICGITTNTKGKNSHLRERAGRNSQSQGQYRDRDMDSQPPTSDPLVGEVHFT